MPVKPTPKPKDDRTLSEPAIREIEIQNLTAMWLWYRRLGGGGQELGHYVMMEIVLGCILEAKRLAAEGKFWVPPDMRPNVHEPRYAKTAP